MACQQVLELRPLVDASVAYSAHTDLAGTAHSAPLARLFLREHLRGRIGVDTLRTAELLATELVANVVMHARSGLHLGVTYDDRNLLVTVKDDDPADPTQGGTDDLAETGRGLTLVSELADDFGWSRLAGEVGKVTWFVLALHPAEGARKFR